MRNVNEQSEYKQLINIVDMLVEAIKTGKPVGMSTLPLGIHPALTIGADSILAKELLLIFLEEVREIHVRLLEDQAKLCLVQETEEG